MTRYLITCISGLLVLLLFWIGGFDFDERGGTSLAASVLALYVMIMVYVGVPLWAKD
jgi:hypothetical protein